MNKVVFYKFLDNCKGSIYNYLLKKIGLPYWKMLDKGAKALDQ